MSIDWHTTSQGPKKKCVHFSRGRINPWSVHTAYVKQRFVKSFNSPTVSTMAPLSSERVTYNHRLHIMDLRNSSYPGTQDAIFAINYFLPNAPICIFILPIPMGVFRVYNPPNPHLDTKIAFFSGVGKIRNFYNKKKILQSKIK